MAVDGPAGMVFPFALILLLAFAPFFFSRQWGALALFVVLGAFAGFAFVARQGGGAEPVPVAPLAAPAQPVRPNMVPEMKVIDVAPEGGAVEPDAK